MVKYDPQKNAPECSHCPLFGYLSNRLLEKRSWRGDLYVRLGKMTSFWSHDRTCKEPLGGVEADDANAMTWLEMVIVMMKINMMVVIIRIIMIIKMMLPGRRPSWMNALPTVFTSSKY